MQPPKSLVARLQAWIRDWGVLALIIYVFFISDTGTTAPAWARFGSLFGYVALQNLMEYPLTTIGWKHRVDTDPVTDAEQVRCDVCGCHIDEAEGEHRRYSEQQVVFGVPLRTTDWGENVYCVACESPVTDETKVACDRDSAPATSSDEFPLQSESTGLSDKGLERD